MIDLDANATTRLDPEVLEAMLPWLRDGYANPSGTYAAAKLARAAIEQARGQVAALINAQPDEIIFTGGGTESVNTALHSLDQLAGPGKVVTSAIEHSAVMQCARSLHHEHRLVAVDVGGRVNLDDLSRALDGAAWVSIMTANNETGVLQPMDQVVRLARERGLPVHTDAVQAAGKTMLDVRNPAVDMLSLSAHKFHGPKGMGVLYVRNGLRFEPWLRGGGQEAGRRSGTENTAGIVGMGVAALVARRFLTEGAGAASLAALRDAFEARLLSECPGLTINGDLNHRLPNTSHVSFENCDAAGMLILLDKAGVACSAGSACLTGKNQPSHVQVAMGIPAARARTSLRFSFSRFNTMSEAIAAADAVTQAAARLRRVQGTGVGPVAIYPG